MRGQHPLDYSVITPFTPEENKAPLSSLWGVLPDCLTSLVLPGGGRRAEETGRNGGEREEKKEGGWML